MGTNFYLRGHRHDDSPEFHIGKRSAAGLYCWDCDVTLCLEGESGVHHRSTWYDACPSCGRSAAKESLGVSAVGRELGFNKSQPQAKKGIGSCSSFSWAIELERLLQLAAMLYQPDQVSLPFLSPRVESPKYTIEDEYGGLYTLVKFRQILDECPIQFTHMIGQVFC
jgi:hypothetical protein